jgi:trk system potassium uptake protein TrkH
LLKLTPPRAIAASFAAVILIGTFFLTLPVSGSSGTSTPILTALFTATSATCVTGLSIVTTCEHWSVFGKIVILLLIQTGSLGLLTFFAVAALMFRRQMSLKTSLVIQAAFNQESVSGMKNFAANVIKITAVIEVTGAVLLTVGFLAVGESFGRALFNGIFHSVSAFCNAGFDNIGADNLTQYRNNPLICGTISALIISGGLGFPVWTEFFRASRKKLPFFVMLRRFSLQTKLAVSTTIILLIIGTTGFLVFESMNQETLGNLSFLEKLSAAFFQSVSMRTAGFNTISQSGLKDISKLFACGLMFIGGSPAGTAGGIKTVTVAVVFASMLSAFRGKSETEVFSRKMPLDLLQKALTVTCAMLIVIFSAAAALHFTDPDKHFIDLLFECFSAAATVGVTANVTSNLSDLGKIIIIFCMFIGRLSPVTIVVALNSRATANANSLERPEERVIIG